MDLDENPMVSSPMEGQIETCKRETDIVMMKDEWEVVNSVLYYDYQ